MALTSSQLTDITFKKYIANVSTTDNSKDYYSEAIQSRPNILPSDIWMQGDQIPNTAATVSGVVIPITVTLSYYPGTKGGFYDPSNTLKDLIPFNYGDGTSYAYRLYQNNGTQIPFGKNDWFLDPNSGVLTFFSGDQMLSNSRIYDLVNSVVLATSVLPPVVSAWKYIGKKSLIPNLTGLTYSGGSMSVLIGPGLTFSGGAIMVTNIDTFASAGGLTNSGKTFSILLQNDSGLTVSMTGIAIDPSVAGAGLTYSNGQLSTLNTVTSGDGLTHSGNTFSVLLGVSSGLTVSALGLSIDPSIASTGLTYSNGQLSTLNTVTSGNGLTHSGNTFSVLLDVSSGLTVSSSGLSIDPSIASTGLTYSNGQLSTLNTVTSGDGLTHSGNTFSVLLDVSSGLTVSSSGLSVDQSIAGEGLTWSSGRLLLNKYSANVSFSSGTTTINHNLNSVVFLIQMYETSTGDEILPQYGNRTSTTIDITVSNAIDATIILIG
jgi:hypothetical protein